MTIAMLSTLKESSDQKIDEIWLFLFYKYLERGNNTGFKVSNWLYQDNI
jgi:hypothetical protein